MSPIIHHRGKGYGVVVQVTGQENIDADAMQGDPEQDLPAHRTEVQPPELSSPPFNNANLKTIEVREEVAGGGSLAGDEEGKNNEE